LFRLALWIRSKIATTERIQRQIFRPWKTLPENFPGLA